jgi:hypothetical protein
MNKQQTADPSKIFNLANSVSNEIFISHAFCGLAEDEYFIVAGFSGDPMDIEPHAWGGRAGPPGIPSCIQPNHNNYIAVSSFKHGIDNKVRRRKDQFSRMFAVMVDDVGTKVKFDDLALAPSARVETSPGNYQDWYFIYPPVSNRLKAEALVEGMIENGLTADGADPGMRGVTRYGRLPVGVNGKAKYVEKLGHEFQQNVIIWSPTTRYSIEEIANAYGVDLNKAAQPRRKSSNSKKLAKAYKSSGEDAFLELLHRANLYTESVSSLDGAHRIVCPWVHEHTDEDPTGTVYFEPSEENDWRGGFKCHHGHCQSRNIADLSHFMTRLLDLNQE